MSQSQESKDVSLGMADLNINKDHDVSADTSNGPESGSNDLAAVVDDLLNQLSNKFTTISSDLLAKMDEMSRRLDNLESSIQASAKPQNDESK